MPDYNGPEFTFTAEGDTAEVITQSEAEQFDGEYRVEALAGRFRFAHEEADTPRGDILRPTQSGSIRPFSRQMHARVDRMPDHGNAVLLVRRKRFDFVRDAASTLFSATDRADENQDTPVATDAYDQTDGEVDLQIEGESLILDPPGRASEVTVHAESFAWNGNDNYAWLTDDAFRCEIRFVGDGDISTVRDETDNPDLEGTGANAEVFVSADLPTVAQTRVRFAYSGANDGATPKGIRYNVVVR